MLVGGEFGGFRREFVGGSGGGGGGGGMGFGVQVVVLCGVKGAGMVVVELAFERQ